eukprot:UN26114
MMQHIKYKTKYVGKELFSSETFGIVEGPLYTLHIVRVALNK